MKVLVAVNEPEFADRICDFVTQCTWSNDTEFTIFSVVEPLKIGSIAAVLPGPVLDELHARNEEQSSAVVAKTKKVISDSFNIAHISQKIVEGLPAQAILEFARSWKADLIIMGSHNRPDLSRIFLGSVSLAVVSKAPCSVMIVKRVAFGHDSEKQQHELEAVAIAKSNQKIK